MERERKAPEKASKYKFVCWSKFNKKWRARLRSGGKQQHLGYFHTELEAAEAVGSRRRQLDRASEVSCEDADEPCPRASVAPCTVRTAHHKRDQEEAGKTEAQPEKASKYNFVYWCKDKKKWRARLKNGGKSEHLGYFHTELEAAEAVDKRLRQLDRASEVNFELEDADEACLAESIAPCRMGTARHKAAAERKARVLAVPGEDRGVTNPYSGAKDSPCEQVTNCSSYTAGEGEQAESEEDERDDEEGGRASRRLGMARKRQACSHGGENGPSTRARRSTANSEHDKGKERASKPKAESACKAGEHACKQVGQPAGEAKFVGDRISVHWPLDKCAYTGTVAKRSGLLVLVAYDDGERHWAEWEGSQWVDTAEVSGDDEPDDKLTSSLFLSALEQSQANRTSASHSHGCYSGVPKHGFGTGRSTVATTKPEPAEQLPLQTHCSELPLHQSP
jgi:hypothetical protein